MFNWLSQYISGAYVLDCFAGAGGLGFEAASREATQVSMIDSDPRVVANLQLQKSRLGADHIQIFRADILSWLNACEQSFDIVFIDPPYSEGHLRQQTLELLSVRSLLNPGCKIYLEWPHNEESGIKMDGLDWIKQKKAGQVAYALAQWQGSR